MAEAGRTDLMIAAGLKVPNEAFAMVIVRLEIDFKREMTWPGDVLIQTAVARIGGKSIHMRQTIASGAVETAQALSILAAIDRHTRRAIAARSVLARALRTLDIAGLNEPAQGPAPWPPCWTDCPRIGRHLQSWPEWKAIVSGCAPAC